MPEICRFYGIVIKMYFADHAPPHFHAEYAEYEARIAIDGLTPSSETVHLLRQEGIDASGHMAQTLTDAMIHQAGLILVMEPHHREHIIRRVPEAQRKTFLLTQYGLPETPPSLGGGIHDPIGKPMEMYERCFTDIRDAVDRVVQALLAAR